MTPATVAALLLLASTALVLAADPAAACPEPTSGNGLATCEGGSSAAKVTTTGGPYCWNEFCPGVTSEPAPGTCMNWYSNGNQLFEPDVCVPVTLDGT